MIFRLLPLIFLLAIFAFPADWPQHQCDAQKSGFQPGDTISPSHHAGNAGYRIPLWAWASPETTDIRGGTTVGGRLSGQVVVASGIAVIASLTGYVYAINAATGAEAWRADAGAPVLSTCAIADNKVIAATQAGTLKAFTVSNGAPVWTYAPGGKGFAAPPTVKGGRLYIGSKDGVFHCINMSTGASYWTFKVGGALDNGSRPAPILCGAAVLGARVFFGAENMQVYALDTISGGFGWKRSVRGQSFTGSWIVASAQAGGTLVARTQPVYAFHDLLDDDESYIQAQTGVTGCGANPLGDINAWIAEQSAVSARLSANQNVNTFWAMNASDGTDRFTQPLPVLYTFGVGNTPAPPVVDDNSNVGWIICRSVYARFDGMGVRCFGEFAKLNLGFNPAVYTNASLGETALGIRFFPCQGTSNCKMAFEDFHKIADEGEMLTGCKNAALSSTWVSDGGVHLATGKTFNVQMYSADDTGGSPLYGTGTGITIANNRAFCRDSKGVKCYD